MFWCEGIADNLVFFAVYCAYALALFYGVKLVNRGEIKDGGAVVT